MNDERNLVALEEVRRENQRPPRIGAIRIGISSIPTPCLSVWKLHQPHHPSPPPHQWGQARTASWKSLFVKYIVILTLYTGMEMKNI